MRVTCRLLVSMGLCLVGCASIDKYQASGMRHLNAGKYAQAREVYQEALGKFPESTELRLGLARVELDARRFEAAAVLAQGVLEQAPQTAAYLVLSYAHYGAGNLEEAASVARDAVTKGMANAPLFEHLGRLEAAAATSTRAA
ncbi:MAG: tetratricopeptide repeat protein [Myxococcota bacterium]